MGLGSFLTHSTDRKPIDATGVRQAQFARIEDEAKRVVRVVRDERTRPVAAIAASFLERTTPKVAGGREKKAVAVRASEAATFHTVLCCPLAGGIVHHFLPLYKGGGTPSVVGGGGIVAGLQDGQVVGETVVAIR